MMDGTRAILAAVARADLVLTTMGFWLKTLAPGLVVGGLLRLAMKREEKKNDLG